MSGSAAIAAPAASPMAAAPNRPQGFIRFLPISSAGLTGAKDRRSRRCLAGAEEAMLSRLRQWPSPFEAAWRSPPRLSRIRDHRRRHSHGDRLAQVSLVFLTGSFQRSLRRQAMNLARSHIVTLVLTAGVISAGIAAP